jgi:hypothetical protein
LPLSTPPALVTQFGPSSTISRDGRTRKSHKNGSATNHSAPKLFFRGTGSPILAISAAAISRLQLETVTLVEVKFKRTRAEKKLHVYFFLKIIASTTE